MGGEVGWIDSLPLLPAGIPLFIALPARAVVLHALAPAIGEGLITIADGDRTGVIVIRGGQIAEAVTFDGEHRKGDAALQSMSGWDSAVVSASRLTETAMSILGPLIAGEPCYEDLRLDWTRWAELLDDLRSRGETFVVEVRTPAGRGVTVIRGGEQVATYTEGHASLGEPMLIAALVEGESGSVRVTVGPEPSARVHTVVASATPDDASATHTQHVPVTATPTQWLPVVAMRTRHVSVDAVLTQPGDPTAANAEMHTDSPPDLDCPTIARDSTGSAQVNAGVPLMAADDPNAGNLTLTALFGDALRPQASTPLVVLAPPERPVTTSVTSLLPELKHLVQQRLQRSAGPVDDVVDAAADGGESVAWLADRVRVMTIRGFMTSTLEQLAEDMLALTGA